MRAMRRAPLAAAMLTLALGGSVISPLLGQGLSLKGHNSNAPVDWQADRIEVQDRAQRVILTGNVVARQAELTLTAARVTVAYTNNGRVNIQRLDASGGVRITTPSETARGDVAIYDLDRRLITMIGGVTLVQGTSNVRGGRLVLDLDSGRAVMDGGGAAGRSPNGRVSGTFTVPQRN
jgi:lipopolysaccharide export system protein LptA